MLNDGPKKLGAIPTWRLIDPRPIQKENPYTFFTPSNAEKMALEDGDLVKLIFENTDPNRGAIERMWVIYRGQNEDGWYGELNNEPTELEGLSLGDTVNFDAFHVVSVRDRKIDTIGDEDRFLARCHVDSRILDDDAPIVSLKRKKPKRVWWWQRKRTIFPDTGWHIYAAESGTRTRKNMVYVAIGVVLHKDDSYLELLGAPIGTILIKDNDSFKVR